MSRSVGSGVVTVNDVLDGHTVLDLSCLDRLYLSGFVQRLQTSGGVVYFLHEHRGMPIASPAVFEQIGARFRDGMRGFAEANHIPVVRFRRGERKVEVMRPHLAAGDECFVIGRHIGLEGLEFNTPAARFGAVSIMNPGKILQEQRQHPQESIVVEARSLGGYSGAPVFVYQAPPITEPIGDGMKKWPVVVQSYPESGLTLLGITWGHMNGRVPVEGPWLDLTKTEKALAVLPAVLLTC